MQGWRETDNTPWCSEQSVGKAGGWFKACVPGLVGVDKTPLYTRAIPMSRSHHRPSRRRGGVMYDVWGIVISPPHSALPHAAQSNQKRVTSSLTFFVGGKEECQKPAFCTRACHSAVRDRPPKLFVGTFFPLARGSELTKSYRHELPSRQKKGASSLLPADS